MYIQFVNFSKSVLCMRDFGGDSLHLRLCEFCRSSEEHLKVLGETVEDKAAGVAYLHPMTNITSQMAVLGPNMVQWAAHEGICADAASFDLAPFLLNLRLKHKIKVDLKFPSKLHLSSFTLQLHWKRFTLGFH